MRRIREPALVAAIMGGAAFCLATGASAQAVEMHPAPILTGAPAARLDADLFASRPDDPTPFGVNLGGLVLVDGKANGGKIVAHGSGGGVDFTYGGPTAQSAALRRRLEPFLGQPLSFRLLSAIQTEVTRFYREAGRSLVSVTVPQQEITGGVVQINVTTFVLAGTRVEGVDPQTQSFLGRQLRLRPGQEVDTDTLLDDVNWLNLNPFRHVSVVFEPGSARDSTDLTLRVRTGRPWSGYVGLSNAGTEDTGVLRLFGGFNAAPLTWQDQQLSYQMTISPESVANFRLWDAGRDKGYISHAVTYFAPLSFDNGFRTKLTFGASHISSYSVPVGSSPETATETLVLNTEAAVPLPKTSGRFSLVPEIYAQVEFNGYDKTTFFTPPLVDDEDTRLMRAGLGLRSGMSGQLFGKSARGSFDIGLFMGRQETDSDPVRTYSYAKISLKQEIFLDQNRSLAFRLSGQYAPDALHPLEQMALGGDGTVRGYPVNGVAGDSAVAASVEYRMAPWSFKAGTEDGQFSPHVFLDVGFADAEATGSDNLASIGFGGEIEVGRGIIGSLDIARALSATDSVAEGDMSVAFQITTRF